MPSYLATVGLSKGVWVRTSILKVCPRPRSRFIAPLGCFIEWQLFCFFVGAAVAFFTLAADEFSFSFIILRTAIAAILILITTAKLIAARIRIIVGSTHHIFDKVFVYPVWGDDPLGG